MPHSGETRKSIRQPVVLEAQCRTQTGVRDEAWISDLSAEGCRLELGTLYVRPGMRLTVRPAGMEGIAGIVRWCDRNLAGIEFENPLYGPVFAHLGDRYAKGQPVSISLS